MSDSQGTVTEIPAGVDPLDALDAIERGETSGQEASPPDATNGDTPPGSGDYREPQQTQAPEAPADPPAQVEEWVMPGKFRSVQDLVDGYLNVEQKAGRLAQEVGQYRQQAPQPQLPQQAQAPQPYMPVFNHPASGYTQEQIEQLQYENPAQLADYFGMVRAAEAMSQLVPALAPLMENVNQQSARNAVETLRRAYGDEVVQRHSPALAELIASDEGYFLDEDVRVQRLAMAVESLEYKHLQQQAQAQPRRPNGTFAAKPAPAAVHVEGGSTGSQPEASTAAPAVDPAVAEMRGVNVLRDRFGTVPPELQRQRG